jgi:HIRAN domain
MPKKKHRPKTLTLDVVGLQYRLTKSMIRVMAANRPLEITIMREPDNVHDENAIAVHLVDAKMKAVQGLKIGYLRKEVAAEIAPLLDSKQVKLRRGILKMVYPDDSTGTVDLWLQKKT